MIGLDSWVFLEYLTGGSKYEKCKRLILGKQTKVISPVVLMEVKYKATKKRGRKNTNEFIHRIITDPSVLIVNVDTKVAQKAANLRLKHYKKGTKELSYSDCIHLATAILTKCNKFYSGDPDFKGIKEIPVEII